jgi:hypothetical protein
MVVITEGGKLYAVNAEISGNINAGTIGGFRINSNSMESVNAYSGGKFVLYPDNGFIAFINDTTGVWSGLGINVMPSSIGVVAVARFENNMSNPYGLNIGVYINVTNANQNIAIIANGSVIVSGLLTSYGYAQFIPSSAQNVLPIKQSNNFIVKTTNSSYITVYLPLQSEIASALGILSMAQFNVRVLVNAHYLTFFAFNLYPPSYCIMYDQNGNNVNYVSMNKGDTYEFLLAFDGNYYFAQIINHLQ